MDSAPLLDWLQQGETILVLKNDGQPLGKFIPATNDENEPAAARRDLFASRFAPLMTVPQRDLSSIVTAVDRVSHFNGGLFFLPGERGLGFTPLINGVSKPFVMDLDGRNKRDVSGKDAGFAYGYSASPDGRLISYHENYQVYIANALCQWQAVALRIET